MSRSTRPSRHRSRPRDRRPRAVEPASPELEQRLLALASMVEEAAELEGWGAPPQIIRVVPAPGAAGEIELGIRPTDDGEGVVATLAGFRAPAHWHVIGVATEGSGFHIDNAGRRRAGSAGRVRVVHLVHRSGVTASAIRRQDHAAASTNTAPDGRVDDYCRRALGIATAPPSVSTLELWAVQWLDLLLLHEPITWPDAVELHPAITLLRNDPASLDDLALDLTLDVADIGCAFANVATWERMRADCIAGRWGEKLVSAPMAAWFDEGSFSRAVLEEWPAIDDLAGAVLDLLPVPVARQISDTLNAWQLCTGNT
jgi:hypothetical protein